MKIKISRFLLRDNPYFFKKSRKIYTRYGTLFVTAAEKTPLIAVIAAKKQMPLATQRNFAKRKMRAVLSHILQHTKPLVIVAIIDKKLITEKYQSVVKEIEKSLYGV